MKKYLLLAALFIVGIAQSDATSRSKKDKVTPEAKGVASINRTTAEAHIDFLACDELEGREAGWKGGRIAGNYIISCLKQMGLMCASAVAKLILCTPFCSGVTLPFLGDAAFRLAAPIIIIAAKNKYFFIILCFVSMRHDISLPPCLPAC